MIKKINGYQGVEGERDVELLIHKMGCGVSSRSDKNFVELDSDDGCINVNTQKTPLNFIL